MPPPDGGFVGFIRLPKRVDEETLVRRLRDRHSTYVTPGRFFRAPGNIRIGFGGPKADLEEGLRRISAALQF